jgi:hypothetical protein
VHLVNLSFHYIVSLPKPDLLALFYLSLCDVSDYPEILAQSPEILPSTTAFVFPVKIYNSSSISISFMIQVSRDINQSATLSNGQPFFVASSLILSL